MRVRDGHVVPVPLFVALAVAAFSVSQAEILTPPYFNLATGRKITATATCGEDTEGPELYCKLVGANADSDVNNVNLIQGQFCDVCDPTRTDKMHPPEFAVDGIETWWQSPPLSRGMKYNEVNLTIDLGQEFHVAYVYIRMGNSPRPGLWVLEKSKDYGKTYVPWQYFSDSEADCIRNFGPESLKPITQDDSVTCATEYSKIVPLEGGEIPISILNNRPSANNYFNSTLLQEWTRATNVRFRFLRTKNFLGHLMSVARQDPTVTRRYYYSIKDISIGGRCMCNGHADTCDIPDPNDLNIFHCRCQHNTCGHKCQQCCSGFEQKAWRISKAYQPFVCEPCNCFQHSNECEYDPEIDKNHQSLDINGRYEGGGVCKNCQHNTEGINCNRCKAKFYKPFNKHWNETDVCQPCECSYFYSTGNCEEGTGRCECRKEFTPPNCDACSFGYYDYPNCKPCECYLNGTSSFQCEPELGECFCKDNFGGKYCKECADNYYNFPECEPCECNTLGSISTTCEQKSGNCTCKNNYGGKQCDQCQHGYYNYPSCSYCNCDIKGTLSGICNKETGQCLCKEGYGGEQCDQCLPGYYGYPDCKPCNCSLLGSASSVCDASGKCPCLGNFGGRTCEQCSVGYYKYPECLPCNCDTHGSLGVSCDSEGKCQCHHNFDGATCDKCLEGFYNFPSCEECNCNPAGVVAEFAGCGSVPAGELCKCKDRVQGRICDQCRPLYWNLHLNNPEGCEKCDCHIPGVLGGIGVCDLTSGQCVCKPSVYARGCTECIDGTYNLSAENLFGCIDCGCDIGGAISPICDKDTGQCPCQSRVTGRTCKEPLPIHYFPTLYQYQYEVEDGHTPAYTAVRYAYEETVFPGYSWKGYAVFSLLQNEILQDLFINKPSLYRIVLRYVNPNPETVIGTIKITPDHPTDIEQTFQVQFKNTSAPAFVTVSGISGNIPSTFVMNPGRWTVSIQAREQLFLDYFVLLPEDFYSATILNQKVEEPCVIGGNQLCRDYSYPIISDFDVTWGNGGYTSSGTPTDYYTVYEHLNQLNVSNKIPLLYNLQPEIAYNITVTRSGQYVIVVNYVTPLNDPKTHNVDVELFTQNRSEAGKILLTYCPYTTVCRQVITNENSGVGVYFVNGNTISIKLRGQGANVGIQSILAIPVEEWSLDYIKLKPICIKKEGTCITSSFPDPPESKKVHFELDSTHPTHQFSNASTYILLDASENMVDMRAKVNSPGAYVFVVHYYQPDHPEFKLDVIVQNGQFYEAKLPVPHCPSYSGCRAVVKQKDGNMQFSLTENVMITLKDPNKKGVYLDYLLIIPSDLYNERILEEDTLDRTGEFVSTCGKNDFNIDTSEEGFCRDSVFSITAAHNNGALPCQCDFDGSLSFKCDKFGGQCLCKPNVIGRTCEACKTGYYGFPDCKPCNCPSTAVCEANTGRCICPPHVTGERCDQCMPLTYGYDPIIGCEECKCNPLGVENTLQCDLFNGSCACKNNIVGRKCDMCQAGHFSYPYCEICGCDPRGTTVDICDQESAECFCKKYVTGPQCTLCKEDSFNLQESNDEGCTKCFCFGKTTRCSSSGLFKILLVIMDDWKLVALNETDKLQDTPVDLILYDVDTHTVGAELTSESVKGKVVYFSAPDAYLNKKLTAYGGFLNYTVFYTIGSSGKAVGGADVILKGRNTYLTYSSHEQPAPALDFDGSVQLVESNFQLPNGLPAKREHMMTVLHELQGIFLRATYWTASVTTRLSNVMLDDAVPPEYYNLNQANYEYATAVEQCQCPPGYQGLSCEDCASGYYRIPTGPHGGYCVPCKCNGHSDVCDVNTGICLDCQHSTRGDYCDQCAVGYHGNALQGTPMDCLICACPLPVPSNNFANACEVSADGEKISCECNEGYFGARCQSCAAGYFGRPESLGDFCKPCECSGNIIPGEPGSCDTVTGDCLRCQNNTYGVACALCAPGFFGDAIHAKDCQACICDQVGTYRCNSYNGTCECKPNVIGEKCERCELEHYGFQSGQGCTPCKCGLASLSAQCDDATGQCRCKPGVTGRACDRCAAGYWNYTEEGCVSCGCKTEYSVGFGCNAQTGQCECLEGVIGEKCNQCPYRWAFVEDVGCHSCDSCTHNLLDDTDYLQSLIDPAINEFDSVDSGYFTTRRLTHINDTLNELRPKVDLLDPNQIQFEPILSQLEELEQDSKNMNRKAIYATENSKNLASDAENIQEESFLMLDAVREAALHARDSVLSIEELADVLIAGEGPKIDAALGEAEQILKQIKIYNLTGRDVEAGNQLVKAKDLFNIVGNFTRPVDTVVDDFAALKKDMKNFNDKMDDLFNHTQYALNKANEAENLYAKNDKQRLSKKLENIENQTIEARQNLENSKTLLDNTTKYLRQAQNAFETISNEPYTLEKSNTELNNTLELNDKDLTDVEELIPDVQAHASSLSQRAQELDSLLTETRNTSTNAVNAANAYRNIVDAIGGAREAAEIGNEAATDAKDLLQHIADDTVTSSSRSTELLDDADSARAKTTDDLEPRLQEALAKSRRVRSLLNTNNATLSNIIKSLKVTRPLDGQLRDATKTAETADELAQTTLDKVSDSFKNVASEKEQSKHLPKNLDDTNRDILQAKKQIDSVNERLPKLVNTLHNLPAQQKELRQVSAALEEKIKILNQQIALARDVANRIKIGVKFYPNTTLELRIPPNLADLSTSLYVSGYFRTNETNGLILYLGNGEGTNLRRTKSDDYMALEVENGYLVLTIDVGNGPQRVINSKYVADNTWYQFIIDRTSQNVKLMVREEKGKELVHTAEGDLLGPYSIFNLDCNQSKLFVGGYPPQFPIQKQVLRNSFDGEIEELVIGDIPISLWNFKDGNENYHGAMRRDKLVNLQPSTGYRFNGNGYAIIDGRSYSLRSRSDIQMSFNTYASDGLLFVVGKDKTFTSLEIRNGKILYQYNLGSGTKTWYTSRTYNDGQWHTIDASRDGAKGRFVVDGEDMPDRSKPVAVAVVEPFETFFFGGYPQQHPFKGVTNIDFDGCIDNVIIKGNPVDLSHNIKAYGVTPGCPAKVAKLVSFSPRQPGYIVFDKFASSEMFKMNLKFKTKQKDGLIFYATDRDQSQGVSLSLVNGHLKLISQKTELESDDSNYNDNEWHVVTITQNATMLRLDFDDYGQKVTDDAPPPLHILYGDIYVGGVPPNYVIKRGMTGSNDSFAGCITDVAQNGNVFNFAKYTDKFGEILGKCVLDETVGSETEVHIVPPLPPIEEVGFGKTKAPPTSTEDPYLAGIPKRGDGGKDGGETKDEDLPIVTQSPPPAPVVTPGRVPITSPKPPLEPSCALPLTPATTFNARTSPFRYGTANDSRSEYKTGRGKHRKNFDFALNFKTTASEGIIFYVSDAQHNNFVAIYLSNGQVVYVYSGGHAPAVLQSDNVYNDGEWHQVNISRSGPDGKLVIDGEFVADGRLPRNTSRIDLYPPFYIGGIRPEDSNAVLKNLNTIAWFDGCIGGFEMNSLPMENPDHIEVVPCSDDVEPGTYFGVQGGYMRLKDKFKVGLEIDVKMDIKPRNVSGLILSVQGKRDYLVLEMLNGVIRLTVENGKGAITTSFQPDKPHYFCDGQWHNIQAVKSKNVVTLSVDRTYTDPGVGDYRSQSTDTAGALFLGGHRLITRARGLTVRQPFVGCIKNVQVNNIPVKLHQDMAEGHISVGYCPTN